ncbi:MAG: hypothetical protein KY459_16100 [Acidobacteria bacterium]|nr:hypothetical protein [Acidobacteriota bacterium]
MTKYTVSIGGETRTVDLTGSGDELLISDGDGSATWSILWQSENEMGVERDGEQLVFAWRKTAAGVAIMLDGELWEAEVDKGGTRRRRAKYDDHSLSAPMPGSVLRILTTAGAAVKKGEPLLVLEAMKMEHTIAAPYTGVVEKIGCSEGDMVQPGVDLISIAPEPDGEPSES